MDAIVLLKVCFSVLLLWGLWHYGWKQYQLDLLRERLFALRDELFDDVATKRIKLNFDSPAYIVLRQYLNNSIRSCHFFGLNRVVITLLIARIKGVDITKYKTDADKEIERLADDDLKKYLNCLRNRSGACFLKFLIYTNPIMPMLFIAFVTPMLSAMIFTSEVKRLSKYVFIELLNKRFSIQLKAIDIDSQVGGFKLRTPALW